MAVKIWFLMLVGCVVFSATLAIPPWSRGKISQEAEVLVNGQIVREKLEMDRDCRHMKSTATLPDGSSSTSDEDFERGVELIRISEDAGVCYVRFITEQEKEEVATCINGVVTRDTDEPDEEEEELVEGPEVSVEWLSPEQRQQCEGKRIVSLVPAQDDDDAGRKRRQATDAPAEGCRNVILRIRRWRCNTQTKVCVLVQVIYIPVRVCPRTTTSSP